MVSLLLPAQAANEIAIETAPVNNAESVAIDSLPPLEKEPQLVEFVKADYPADLVRKGVSGSVILELLVSDSGRVDSASIVQGIDPLLDSAAMAAARKFVFTPAVAQGKPVAVIIQYAYNFTIDEVLEKTEKYINFKGTLLERGTRAPVTDALIIVEFPDTTADTTLTVPWSAYLAKIGSFPGQHTEAGSVVAVTDSTGSFAFTSLPACSISVRIKRIGYEPFTDRETLRRAEETTVLYRINRVSYDEYQTVVYGQAEKKEVAKRTLTLAEVRKIPGLGGDAVKVVQSLPGVARPTFGSGQIIVRGAPTSNSKFFLDGIEIPTLYHYGLKSTYNSDALLAVDFYPGGFNTRYGGATAGVIEIKPRSAKTDRVHGYADMNFFDASFLAEGPVSKKVSVLASARRSYIGDLLGFAIDNKLLDLPITTQPFYWDYILRTDVSITKNQHASLTFFGSKDAMTIIVPDMMRGSTIVDNLINQVDYQNEFHMAIGAWDWIINDKIKNELRYSAIYKKSHVSIFGMQKQDMDSWGHYVRNELSWTRSKKLTLRLGTDVNYTPGLHLLLYVPSNNIITKTEVNNWTFGVIGAYSNLDWHPIENLLIMPGLRFDYYPELNYDGSILPEFTDYGTDLHKGVSGEPSARLTLRYTVVKDQIIKGAVGNYNQTPKPFGQAIMSTYGDPNMPATKAVQYVLGHEWKVTDLISTDVQFYFNNQWNIPRFQGRDEIATNGRLMVGDQKGRMYGMELMLRHDQGKRFFGWLAYSLSRSERYNRVEKKYSLYEKDQTHNLIAVASWKLPRNYDAGVRVQYATGDPNTPVIGSKYIEPDHYYQAIYGAVNSERLPPAFQVDVRIDKKFVFDKWMLSLYFDLLDLSYFVYKSPQIFVPNYDPYNYKTQSADRYTIDQFFYPSLGLKVEF